MVSIFSLLNHFEHGEIGLKLSGAKKRYGESRLEYGRPFFFMRDVYSYEQTQKHLEAREG